MATYEYDNEPCRKLEPLEALKHQQERAVANLQEIIDAIALLEANPEMAKVYSTMRNLGL